MEDGHRSRTSDWVAAARALYSEAPPPLNVAEDPVARELLGPGLQGILRVAAGSVPAAAIAHRLIGAATFGLSYCIPLRTVAIDDAVRRSIDEGARQLVVLGAGLDARAWRLPELAETTVFELDHPSTQRYKRDKIEALPPLARDVRFCPIDFEVQTIDEVLASADFDTRQPSVWIWEGVTMYLTHDAIDASLDAVERTSAPGSRIAITYAPPTLGRPWQRALSGAIARFIDEELRGYISAADIAERLERRGFRVESDDSTPEWASRYWPKREQRRVRAYERLAVGVRGPKDAGARA